MEMKPENVPDELLTQAGMVCAQLLIYTNTSDIVREILDTYMIGLDIWTMQASKQTFNTIGHGRTFLWANCNFRFTVRFIKPKDDILTQLRQRIDNDIETLYKIIAQQKRKQTICMTTNLQQREALFETAPW